MGKNKRSKAYYIQSAKRQKKGGGLGPDMVGYLCTCNYSERDCLREGYNILNEFADALYGKEFIGNEALGSKSENVVHEGETEKEENEKKTEDQESKETNSSKELDPASALSDSDDEPLDIEAAIKADVSVLKKNNEAEQKKARRFQQVECGAKNVVFIKTTLDDPLPVSLAIMDDILSSQKQRTKKLLRMIPVQATCKAYPEDIEKAVQKLASSYFKETSNTFCVVFKAIYNDTIKKENIVFDLAQILQEANSKNKPDLNLPEVVLNVNVIRNMCCLSLLPHYFTKYSKYNLVILANENKTSEKDKSDKNDKSTVESKDSIEKGTVNAKEYADKAETGTLEAKDSIEKGTKNDEEYVDKAETGTKDNIEKGTINAKEIVDKAETGTMEAKDCIEKGTINAKEIVDKAETGTVEADSIEKGTINDKEIVDKADKGTVDSDENVKAQKGTLD